MRVGACAWWGGGAGEEAIRSVEVERKGLVFQIMALLFHPGELKGFNTRSSKTCPYFCGDGLAGPANDSLPFMWLAQIVGIST